MDTKIVLVICAVVFTMVILLFLFGFIVKYQKKAISFQTEKKVMQSAFEQELLKTQLEIQEQTLKNISQEIHDNIGQVLSLAKLHLATMDAARPESLQEKMTESRNLVSKAIQDLRSLSKRLDTDSVEAIGLFHSVKNELEAVERVGLHKTSLIQSGAPYKLEPNVELIIFRVFQELLNNILKHARAKNIVVEFVYYPRQWQLKINDDGTGFDLNKSTGNNNEQGLGLKNMHNRAKMINADFVMESYPGKGTGVIITLNKT